MRAETETEVKHAWLESLMATAPVQSLCDRATQTQRVAVSGSRGSSTAIVAGAVALCMGRPVLMVVAHPDEADDALDDLALFESPRRAIQGQRFPALEVLPGESAVNPDLLAQRLELVRQLSSGGEAEPNAAKVVIAPVQALMQAVPTPAALRQMVLTVQAGQDMPQGQLLAWLTDAGYERVEAVEQPGQFAVRGGIVDIYLPTGVRATRDADSDPSQGSGGAIRLDYFGDQVETIRLIDIDTMGSGACIDTCQVFSATTAKPQDDSDTTNIISLLHDDTVVIMHETLELAEQARGYYERLTDARGVYAPRAVFKLLTERQHIEINQYSGQSGEDDAMTLPIEALPGFSRDALEAVGELADLAGHSDTAHDGQEAKAKVVVLCQNTAERDRLVELLRQQSPGSEAAVRIDLGYLHRGFVWGSEGDGRKLYIIPHHELFHRYHVRRRLGRLSGQPTAGGKASDAFLDMAQGDYVVHVDHGIARFLGLRTIRRKGKTEDFLTLEFANKAHLHVPASQVELVQRYIGGFQGKPPLSLLGGKRWSKQKQDVAEAVKDLAAELLRVQAARASMAGIRYPPDTDWQHKFEEEFPYDETEDQLAAIVAVKRDMNDVTPMDRLICGDVGFGKTEVAVRAAFKAVEYGKQVAVLVPTTVLAEQHERTFRERVADYPFRVESLSRFKTAKEAAKVLRDLERGEVDIVIGTHRLLSGDIKFADLGLVVVDEEQRFGVEHKQKLMSLRLTVDVLTLSATPIPRTLHMSMLGLRDISSLTTPPMDRRAIVTEVIPFDTQRVKQAIIRELNRDGQIYFVHNRVHDIQSMADEVGKLAPKARIAVGHGQMPDNELEQVMLRFMRREVDILVCTTIIESGLDIPTANTIFIHGADRFGLADLHQLRGRVGRYKHRAYCYLLLPADRPVTDTASRRLRAIEQYSMLGAGFKIAMRDLEIRGAGNLLGKEQSGHIAAVGYEMYCQLLEQAAKHLRNEPIIEPAKTHLELPVAGRLPKGYIASEKFRMSAYRRLSRAATLEELDGVVKSITDAYGDAPEPAQTLMDLAQIRVAATALGVEAVKLDGPDVIFRTPKPRQLEPVLGVAVGRVSVIDETTVYWRPPANYLEPATLLAVLRKLLVTGRGDHRFAGPASAGQG